MTPHAAAGLLLTGGASRRFGSDKARVEVDGLTLAARTAAALGAVASPALEVGPGVSGLDRVIEDDPGSGPLAALAAGWRHLSDLGPRPFVLVVAVDLPRITTGFLSWLAEHPAPGTVVPEVDRMAQPLCARYAPDDLDTGVRLVGAGERSMRALLDSIDVTYVRPEHWSATAAAHVLADVDTPDDLRRLGLAP